MYRQKKKKQGEEEAPSLSTVRGVPQNGDGPPEADVALMRHSSAVSQQKIEATKSPEQSALEPTTIRSKICALSTSAISTSTNARGKNPSKHVGDRHGVLDSQSGKDGAVRLNTLQYSKI